MMIEKIIINSDFSMFEDDALKVFDKYIEDHVKSMKDQAEHFAFSRNEISNAKVTKSAMDSTIFNYGHHILGKKKNILFSYILPGFESIMLGACGVFAGLYFGNHEKLWMIIVALITFFLFLISLIIRILKEQK